MNLVAVAAVVGLLAAATTFSPRSADANPAMAQQTGKQCGFCHSKAPQLNAQGKKFKAKGNKL
jgi:hypothetical protein